MSTDSTRQAQTAAIQAALVYLKATVTKTKTINQDAIALVEALEKICKSTLEIAKTADERYLGFQQERQVNYVPETDNVLEPGQTQLYQALSRRDWDNIYTLALQPDQVADMTPNWMSDVVSDFIQAEEEPEKILGLFEIFNRFNKTGLELMLDPLAYEVFGHLFKFDHITILRRLNQLGLLNKDHRQFFLNRMSQAEEYLIELFPPGLTNSTI